MERQIIGKKDGKFFTFAGLYILSLAIIVGFGIWCYNVSQVKGSLSQWQFWCAMVGVGIFVIILLHNISYAMLPKDLIAIDEEAVYVYRKRGKIRTIKLPDIKDVKLKSFKKEPAKDGTLIICCKGINPRIRYVKNRAEVRNSILIAAPNNK